MLENIKTASAREDEFAERIRPQIGLVKVQPHIRNVIIEDRNDFEILTTHGKYFQKKIEDITHRVIFDNWATFIADRAIPTDEEELKKLISTDICLPQANEVTLDEGREMLKRQYVIKLELKTTGFKNAIRKCIKVSFDLDETAMKFRKKKLSDLESKNVNRIVVFDATVVGTEPQKLIVKNMITEKGAVRPENYDEQRDGRVIDYEYHDTQNLLLEEVDETPTDSKILRKMIAKVYGFHVGIYEIGAKVRVVGYYQAEDGPKGQRKDIKNPFVDALTLHRLEEKKEVIISDDRLSNLIDMAKNNPDDYLKKLTKSVCPSIYENHIPKLAVLLSMIGGVKVGGRKNISVLLVGNPGTGKREVLKWAQQLSNKAVYVDAPNASARGLLYGQEEFDKRKILRAGVMIRYKKVMLDELDKMKDKERMELNTAIEQQVAQYHKTPFDIETPIDLSVVAACNPNSDRWIDDRSILQNMKPLESMIIDRCILIRMSRSHNTAERFAHIVRTSGLMGTVEEEVAPFDIETLAGMITHCSKIEPVLSDKAYDKMESFITSFEQIDQTDLADLPINTRKEVELIRISTAIAKILFRTQVDTECVDIAMDFYRKCFESIGMNTSSLMAQTNLAGEAANKEVAFQLIIRKLMSRHGEGEIPLEGFTEEDVLREMSESSHWNSTEVCRVYWERIKNEKGIVRVYEFTAGRYKQV